MKDKVIEKLFSGDEAGKPEAGKKRDSIKVLEDAVMGKSTSEKIPWWTMAGDQIRYVDQRVLLLQAVFFIVMIVVFLMLERAKAGRFVYLTAGTVFASLTGIFAWASLKRQYSEHFAELGESCYFNIRQMTAIRMTFFGLADLIFLLVLSGFAGRSTGMRLLDIGIYLCVPFLLSEICYTGLMLTEGGRKSVFPAAGMGVVLTAALVFASMFPEIYEKSALFIWYWILAGAVVTLAAEIKVLFRKMEKGEMLCTH